jgi:4-hydroxy-tetrahydrodipicolinate reductase
VIRVGVLGAAGRMGRTVSEAVAAADDLELVAGVDVSHPGERVAGLDVTDRFEALSDAHAEVAVDFTHPDAVMDNVRWCLRNGVHAVVGTTGITASDLDEIASMTAGDETPNAVVAPNFALGAVLMMRFSAEAARYFPAVEVIELHHDRKADAPSGTALGTVRAIEGERSSTWRGPDAETLRGVRGGDADGVRVHSVRLPGLLAHQEVLFGAPGEVLTIRHDSTDRISFMPGVLIAIRAVASRPGLTVGLEPLLPTR